MFHPNIADHCPILASWLVNDLDQTDVQCKYQKTKLFRDEFRRQLFLHELQEHLSLREVEILSSSDPSIAFEIFNLSCLRSLISLPQCKTKRNSNQIINLNN